MPPELLQFRISGVHHVNLLMPDGGEAAARAYYRDVLGCVEVAKPPGASRPTGCWFTLPSVEIHLSCAAHFVPATQAHVALVVHGLEELRERLSQHGHVIEVLPPIGVYDRVHTFDPFGNRIELMQRRFVTDAGVQIRTMVPSDSTQLIHLWQQCDLTRPWNDPSRDIDRNLSSAGEIFVAELVEDGQLVGSVMAGFDGHRGSINYLAVAPQWRRTRVASQLLARVEQFLIAQGCPKLNLHVREGNEAAASFYEAHGYSQFHAMNYGKRLIVDEVSTDTAASDCDC